MRTQEEILERFDEVAARDMFPFAAEVLIGYIDYDTALTSKVLKTDVMQKMGRKKWDADLETATDEAVVGEITTYLKFAIGKAVDHRGLSANRSVIKLKEWLWLLGRDEEVKWNWYAQYGAPILMSICKMFDLDYKQMIEWEGDIEVFENMAEGKACRHGCNEGCTI